MERTSTLDKGFIKAGWAQRVIASVLEDDPSASNIDLAHALLDHLKEGGLNPDPVEDEILDAFCYMASLLRGNVRTKVYGRSHVGGRSSHDPSIVAEAKEKVKKYKRHLQKLTHETVMPDGRRFGEWTGEEVAQQSRDLAGVARLIGPKDTVDSIEPEQLEKAQ